MIGASAIGYASIVTLIFAARYLDILRYAFKLTWMSLGVTVGAEVIGKLVMSNGLATQMRPREYYTIQEETLNALIGDVHELINFFVIEAQRILFAENVTASAAVSQFTWASRIFFGGAETNVTLYRPPSVLSSPTTSSTLSRTGVWLSSLPLPPSSCP